MTALSVSPAYPIFTDRAGQPLENGYIWIGAANQPPQTNPIAVFWDAALTQPAAQPVRTINGYPSNSGSPGRLYVGSDYSLLVQDAKGSLVYSAPDSTERLGDIGSEDVLFVQAGAGAVTRTVQEKLRDAVSVLDFGAVGNGVADDTAAIQAALNHIRDNGGTLTFPKAGTYRVSSALTLLRNTTTGPEQYVIQGNGSTLNFSASGLTSAKLVSLGATSQANGHDTGFIHVSDLRILGPETGAPFSGDNPTGSTTGLSLEFAFNVTLINVNIQSCYIGIRTNFVFPLRALSAELKGNYIGVYLDDDTTLATWVGLSVTSARYAVVVRPTTTTKAVLNQHFVTPRFEQCLVGAVIDPLSGSGIGARSIVFDTPYLEGITFDYFRFGLQWTFANPSTRNANATRDVYLPCINGGLWDGVNWTGTKAPLVCASIATVKGGRFFIPASRTEVIGSLARSSFASTYDANIGDSSVVASYDSGSFVRNDQPAFAAFVGAQVDNVTGDGTLYTIVCGTEDYDVAGDYNVATGIYTARFTGTHILFVKVFLGGVASGNTFGEIQIVTPLKTIAQEFNPFAISNAGEASVNVQWPCRMNAGDTAQFRVRVSGGTQIVDVKSSGTQFAGYFLG
jgi:hypothetical protein